MINHLWFDPLPPGGLCLLARLAITRNLIYSFSMFKKITAIFFMALIGTIAYTPSASADIDQLPAQESSAQVLGSSPSPTAVTPYTASGVSWAPGGAGASVALKVNGNGQYVQNASVAYQTGTNVGNACVDKFEIAYYTNNRRFTQTSGRNCTPLRTSHTFGFNRNIQNNKPFCGRVLVGGTWSNYACIQIRR